MVQYKPEGAAMDFQQERKVVNLPCIAPRQCGLSTVANTHNCPTLIGKEKTWWTREGLEG